MRFSFFLLLRSSELRELFFLLLLTLAERLLGLARLACGLAPLTFLVSALLFVFGFCYV